MVDKRKSSGQSTTEKKLGGKGIPFFLRLTLLTAGLAILATSQVLENVQGAGGFAVALWILLVALVTIKIINKYGLQSIFQKINDLASKIKIWVDGLEAKDNSSDVLSNKKEALIALGIGLPPLDLLPAPPISVQRAEQERTGKGYANRVNAAFRRCGIIRDDEQIEVLNIQTGPGSVRITIQLLQGMQITKLINMSDNLSNSFGVSSIQVEPGGRAGSAALIVPFTTRLPVYLKTIMESEEFASFNQKAQLPMVLGVNDTWAPIIVDLVAVKHILIAGATGSGKSVCLNSIITTLLMCLPPDKLQFVFVDPKMVELTSFAKFPHTMKMATTTREALKSLAELTVEMDKRYEIFQKHSVKNIQHYWKKTGNHSMYYIVVVIDELADLMLMAKQKESEEEVSIPGAEHSIMRLAQKARAAGIHLIIATQRPSVNVITGVIKANLPSRISFYCTSQHDYRTILDETPEFDLMGKGDGLAIIEGRRGRIRFQGACIGKDDTQSEETIVNLERFWVSQPDQISMTTEQEYLSEENLTLDKQSKSDSKGKELQNHIIRLEQLQNEPKNTEDKVIFVDSEPAQLSPYEASTGPIVVCGGSSCKITPPRQMVLLPNLFSSGINEAEDKMIEETAVLEELAESSNDVAAIPSYDLKMEIADMDMERLKYLLAQTWSEQVESNPEPDENKRIKALSIPVVRKILKVKQDRIIQLYSQLVAEKWLEAPPKPGIPYYIVVDPKEIRNVLSRGTGDE